MFLTLVMEESLSRLRRLLMDEALAGEGSTGALGSLVGLFAS